EDPRLDQQLLAAATFLGRSTDQGDTAGQGIPPSKSGASARKAPSEEAAITLCPQPCPTPGSASYSAVIATCGPESGSPSWAVKAVGIPAVARVIGIPAASSSAANASTAWNSWYP